MREVAAECGALSKRTRRALDSTVLYDAVATQDTVTMIGAQIRRVRRLAPRAAALVLAHDYDSRAKPVCDWGDPDERAWLIDELVTDAQRVLDALDGSELSDEQAQAAALLAVVAGQDVEADPKVPGRWRIARRVAKGRVISTVDPEARHARKSRSQRRDGYKAHICAEPDTGLITAAELTTADTSDARVGPRLLQQDPTAPHNTADTADTAGSDTADTAEDAEDADTAEGGGVVEEFAGRPTVYGDSAYGSGEFQGLLQQSRINSRCRTQLAAAPGGRFTKDRFDVDLLSGTVTCPAGTTVAIRARGDGSGTAAFGAACHGCALRGDCTDAAGGRTVRISANEAVLAASRARQRDPAWRNDYRAVRPKVERKLAHLVRRKHGGRHARVRGRAKVDADFNLLAAAANIARLGVLGLRSTPQRWALG